MHTSLSNEPPKVSKRVVFSKFEWMHHIFLNIKTEEWDLKILLLNCWNGSVLGSEETYFPEIGTYVPLKRASTGVRESRLCWIWVIISHFFNIKTEEWDLKILLFNYWNGAVLGSEETYFPEVGPYVSLKRATTGVWECSFCWIWVKIPQFLKKKWEELDVKMFTFN